MNNNNNTDKLSLHISHYAVFLTVLKQLPTKTSTDMKSTENVLTAILHWSH